ncbi:MAG: serine hydrolase [Bdellovibrio sp.]|nr:serine hydrolase [Bdellovibrio sp.]
MTVSLVNPALDEAQEIISRLWPIQHFDTLAFGVVDFQAESQEFFEWDRSAKTPAHLKHDWYFDLASVTKPMILGISYLLRPEIFSPDAILCLEHRGGLPAWGRLSSDTWREKILSFNIQQSPELYSDYSAIRSQLMAEAKLGESLYKLCRSVHDPEMCHWTELPNHAHCPVTGIRQGKFVQGVVHDDNAFYVREKVAHAGLFSTIAGLGNTLLNLQKKTNFLSKMIDYIRAARTPENNPRFVRGWDRALNPELTLAGKGAGPLTFGHLGFTGTSVWINPEQSLGYLLLTNGTTKYWYAKDNLNVLRRELGAAVWKLR